MRFYLFKKELVTPLNDACEAAGITPYCPMCIKCLSNKMLHDLLWLSGKPGIDPLSRTQRDSNDKPLKICIVCSKAEALRDMSGISFHMARVASKNWYDEAIRLPTGIQWGEPPTRFPTGGIDKRMSEGQRRIEAIVPHLSEMDLVQLGLEGEV